jgi:hypothetical protein
VLANRSGNFVDTSDFFHTGKRVIGPRTAQVAIGRSARHLVREHLRTGPEPVRRLVAERLLGDSEWPDAGNLWLAEYFRPVLLRPGASAESAAALHEVIDRAVLAGARRRHSGLSRRRFRHRAFAVLEAEINSRRSRGVAGPGDLLDVVLLGAAPLTPVPDLIEIYLAFVFATVGSIGFALAWSLYLAGSHPETQSMPSAWIVREALRLWPVAWLFGRTPCRKPDWQGCGPDRGTRSTSAPTWCIAIPGTGAIRTLSVRSGGPSRPRRPSSPSATAGTAAPPRARRSHCWRAWSRRSFGNGRCGFGHTNASRSSARRSLRRPSP